MLLASPKARHSVAAVCCSRDGEAVGLVGCAQDFPEVVKIRQAAIAPKMLEWPLTEIRVSAIWMGAPKMPNSTLARWMISALLVAEPLQF